MARAKTTLTLKVKIDLPKGVNSKDARDYVAKAIDNYCGILDPKDPMFALDGNSITIAYLKKEVTYG